MFDKSLGPSFAKVYYQRYINDPTSLSTLYADNAVFSHSEVQQGLAGANAFANDSYGIAKINEQLEMIKRKQSKAKVAILNIDSMPTGVSSVTILVGGYFLYESGPSRFVQNFILKHTGIDNNFIIVNDCLRIYEKNAENSLFSQERGTPFISETQLKEDKVVGSKKSQNAGNAVEKTSVAPEATSIKTPVSSNDNQPKVDRYETLHESWCDEIEREEEELLQQKRDQEKLDMLTKEASNLSIEKEKEDSVTEQEASPSLDAPEARTEPQAFSYAAAAKKAPSSGSAPKPFEMAKINIPKGQSPSAHPSGDSTKKGSSKEAPKAPVKGNRSVGKSASEKPRSDKNAPRRPSRRQGSEDKAESKPSNEDSSAKKN